MNTYDDEVKSWETSARTLEAALIQEKKESAFYDLQAQRMMLARNRAESTAEIFRAQLSKLCDTVSKAGYELDDVFKDCYWFEELFKVNEETKLLLLKE